MTMHGINGEPKEWFQIVKETNLEADSIRYFIRASLSNALNASFTGSPWRDKISLAILELQEKGVIQMLYNRWWKNTGSTCNREDSNKESKASALGVDNIGMYSSVQINFTK